MKVLFVYKGEGESKRNSVIDAQAAALAKEGLIVDKFPLSTSGARSYWSAYQALKGYLRENTIDLIHAHYSYSAFIAALTGKPTICSLMGSDVLAQPRPILFLTKLFYHFIWKKTLVKSSGMQSIFRKASVIPNGVDFDIFKPINREKALGITGFDPSKKNVVFVAEHPESKVKNLSLAKEAIGLISDPDFNLEIVSGKKQHELVYYYNSADLLLMTSLSEGSPNVIKEAMACNLPVVSTDVGDVRERVEKTAGCFVTSFASTDVAAAIVKALEYPKPTTGRADLAGLKTDTISRKIIDIYKSIG